MPIPENKPMKIHLENVKHRPQSPTVKLLLAKDQDGAQIEVKGGYFVYDPFTGKQIDNAYTGSSCYMYPTTEGIKWGEEFPGVHQLLIVPKYGTFLVSGIEYRGMLYAYQIEGALAFVNELAVDDLVDSILSSKISPKISNKEVLAALAIVARGDALTKSYDTKSAYYDMKASMWDSWYWSFEKGFTISAGYADHKKGDDLQKEQLIAINRNYMSIGLMAQAAMLQLRLCNSWLTRG